MKKTKQQQQSDLLSHVAIDPTLDSRVVAGALAWLTHAIAEDRGYIYPRIGGGWNYWDDAVDERWDVNDWIRVKYPVLRDQALAARVNGDAADPASFEVRTIPVLTPVERIVDDIGNDPEEDEYRTQRVVWMRVSARLGSLMRRIGVFIVPWLLLIVVLSGSSCGPEQAPPAPSLPQVRHVPHRGPVALGYCGEASAAYGSLLQNASVFVGKGLVAAVREDADPLTFWTTYVDASPLSPDSSPLAITLPATPAYPVQTPTLEPLPTPSGNVYADAQHKQAVEDRNAQKIQSYTDAIKQVDDQVAAVRTTAQQTATQLAALQPPESEVSDAGSVWGCVGVMARRFNQTDGKRIFVLATRADEKTWRDIQPVSELSGLKGATVYVIYYSCTSTASFCSYKQATWDRVFQNASVAGTHWLDPGESQAADPSILFAGV